MPNCWVEWPALLPNAAMYVQRRYTVASGISTVVIVVAALLVLITGIMKLAGA